MSDALRQLIASFTTSVDTKPLDQADKKIDSLVDVANKAGKAIAGAFIVRELWGFVDGLIEAGAELGATSERLGLSTEQLQEWRYAAGQVHVSAEELTVGLRVLQRNMFNASSAGGDAGKAFAAVGVPVKDASGKLKTLDEIMPQLADKFAALQDPVKKTALAQEIFGRSGASLVPLLDRGAAGVQEMHDKFIALGGGLSNEAVKAAEDAARAIKDLELASTSMKSRLTAEVLPFVTKMIETVTDWGIAFREAEKDSEFFKASIIVLGTAGAVALYPLLAEFIAIAAPIAVAILLVDDLLVMFKGGKSVIGDFIDAMFGVGASKTFVQELKGSWDDLGKSIKFIVDQVKWLIGHWNEATGAVGSLMSGGRRTEHEHGADGFGSTVVAQSGVDAGGIGRTFGLNRDAIVGYSAAPARAPNLSDTGYSPAPWMSGLSVPGPTLESRAPSVVNQTNNVTVPISLPPGASMATPPELERIVKRAVDTALTSHADTISGGT